MTRIVVMGVSGCGKSTLAQALATRLGLSFIEGDSLHSQRNVAVMAAGTALTDADRQEWLLAVAASLAQANTPGAVASCSALKRSYRDTLRERVPGLRFIHLNGSPDLIANRLRDREGHYMPASLLQSQLDTLEQPQPDEAVLTLALTLGTDQQADLACRQWGLDARAGEAR